MFCLKSDLQDIKVVFSQGAKPEVRHAARELAHHLSMIVGRAIPTITDYIQKSGPEFWVGYSKRTAELDIPKETELVAEELLIETFGENLLLVGGEPRGTLYAVYEFLEEFCGVRWFALDCTHIPETASLEIPDIKVRKRPVFEYRENNYYGMMNPDFASKNRINRLSINFSPEHGGGWLYAMYGHSFDRLVPPGQYMKSHPEYYALRDGIRAAEGHYSQLCLTNPEVLKISEENLLKIIAQVPGSNVVAVCQNDSTQPCQCESCQEIVKKEGSESGPIIYFVNALAEEVEKHYPDMLLDTYAYDYSRKVPKYVRPRHNVVIRLCSFECCFSHPFEECREIADAKKAGTPKEFEDFAGDVEKWGEISKRIWIYDYAVDFEYYINIHPNFQVLKDNIRFFAKNNCKGVYSESCALPKSEMAELRGWLLAKLMWNPDFDVDKGMDEFLSAYFGPAGEQMRAYIDIAKDALLESGYHISLGDTPTAPFITAKLLEEIDVYFDKAEELVADNPVYLERIKKERIGIRFTWFFHRKPDENRDNEVDDFINETKALGFTKLSTKWGTTNTRRIATKGVWPPLPEDMEVIQD